MRVVFSVSNHIDSTIPFPADKTPLTLNAKFSILVFADFERGLDSVTMSDIGEYKELIMECVNQRSEIITNLKQSFSGTSNENEKEYAV